MIRSQILLTPEIDEQIKKIAQKKNLSQSEVVRTLLVQALAISKAVGGKGATVGLKFVYNLEDFTDDNPRIKGFKELYSVGANTPEIKVIGDSVFRYYLEQKKLPEDFIFEIYKHANELKELSETGKLVVRRAYVVPGLENPPGPRFLGLKVESVIESIEQIFNFAIEHEYYVKKTSQICAFVYPFADPKPVKLPLKSEDKLPYGGYAIPLNKSASRVEVLGVWGNNEGVQSFDAIDRYVVDSDRMIILEKDVPQKSLMLATTAKNQSEKLNIPLDYQFEQVLTDAEILESARIVKELVRKFGPRRIEFSFDGRDKLIYNESTEYKLLSENMRSFSVKGKVFVVSNSSDLEALRNLSEAEVKKVIVCIDKSIVEERAYDTLNSVAGLSKKFTILYPGLSATAHAMRVLNDFGHNAVVVGNRKFRNNEDVLVKIEGGEVDVKKLSKKDMSKYIVNLYDAKLYGREIVGGKAYNLSLLKSKGFSVPHGVVLTTDLFSELLEEGVGKSTYKKTYGNEVFDKTLVKNFAFAKISFPELLWGDIERLSEFKNDKAYAIRSSATVEDQAGHSFAGQFESFLNISLKDIKTRAIDVMKSTFNSRVVEYHTAMKIPWKTKMAVVIQEMINAAKSGVIFGKDLQTGDEDLIVIDVKKGLAEGVVSGTSKTQRLIYSRNKDTLVNEHFGREKRLLDRIEIDALIEMTLSVERLMGRAQDIEWSIDREGNLWIIQSRDM